MHSSVCRTIEKHKHLYSLVYHVISSTFDIRNSICGSLEHYKWFTLKNFRTFGGCMHVCKKHFIPQKTFLKNLFGNFQKSLPLKLMYSPYCRTLERIVSVPKFLCRLDETCLEHLVRD